MTPEPRQESDAENRAETAPVVHIIAPEERPAGTLAALGLSKPARLVILVLGGVDGFDDDVRERLERLAAEAIVPAAIDNSGAIVDGATRSGIREMVGQAAAERREDRPVLLGVAPRAKIAALPGDPPRLRGIDDLADLDPNHTHVALTPGRKWGDELHPIFDLAAALAAGNPVVALLAGGGDYARAELVQAVRRKWPVILLRGSGRLADKAGDLLDAADRNDTGPDGALLHLLHQGRFQNFPILHDPEELRRMIAGRQPADQTLPAAKDLYQRYDLGARVQQDRFRTLQDLILTLGAITTFLAIGQVSWSQSAVHIALIGAPILTSLLVARSSQFRPGDKWVLLRAAAERVKREIFRYRASSGVYQPERCREISKETRLQAAIQEIGSGLAQTDVNFSHIPDPAMPPRLFHGVLSNALKKMRFWRRKKPEAPSDDLLSPLSGDAYAGVRLEDQVRYYDRTVRRLEARLRFWRTLAYVAGAGGTFLAAINQDRWVALTTALATAFMAKLEIDQVQNSIVQYNQALSGLRSLRMWWFSLSAWEKPLPRNIDFLVDTTEHIVEGEQVGWVQQMQSALDRLRKQQAESAAAKERKT